MAYPIAEISKFRAATKDAVDALRDLEPLLAIVEDHGANDAERALFFDANFGEGQAYPDITWAEFVAGIQGLRAMRDAWNTNKENVVKLLL